MSIWIFSKWPFFQNDQLNIFFKNVEEFFLIPRKYLEFFFFFLCECLEASFRRPENIIIIAIIINHGYCHIPPSHPFLLQELSPVHSASLTPGNHFSIVLKLWNLTFATTCLFCALWLFPSFAGSCLGRICRAELSSTSLQQTPACRAHPANQPFSHGAVTHRLCQMLLPWFQIFMLTAVHLTVLLEITVSLQGGGRGACVCTWATSIRTACPFKLPVKSLCPHLWDHPWDYSLPVEEQGIRLEGGNIQKCGSFVLQYVWARAQTTCTK